VFPLFRLCQKGRLWRTSFLRRIAPMRLRRLGLCISSTMVIFMTPVSMTVLSCSLEPRLPGRPSLRAMTRQPLCCRIITPALTAMATSSFPSGV
ncbi:uncharacterized protein METZ01_LOCUS142940, partial [marine metagenome]